MVGAFLGEAVTSSSDELSSTPTSFTFFFFLTLTPLSSFYFLSLDKRLDKAPTLTGCPSRGPHLSGWTVPFFR